MYSDEDKKQPLVRQYSITSSFSSASSSASSRISDVTPPTSRAPSIASQRSFISQYSIPRRASSASQSAASSGSSTTPSAARQGKSVRYGDICVKPEYRPITILNKSSTSGKQRLINVRLRRSSSEEDELFAARMLRGEQTYYEERDLTKVKTLYEPAASYMLDFDIARGQGPIPCSVRLSCCGFPGYGSPGYGFDNTVIRILRTSQVELERGAAYVELPKGFQLDQVDLPAGLFGRYRIATSAILFVDATVPEDSLAIHSATVISFRHYRSDTLKAKSQSVDELAKDSKAKALSNDWDAFSLDMRVPMTTSYRPGDSTQRLEWHRLQGLETAFPDWLYSRDDATIKQWLGESSGGRNRNFELRDVRCNLYGTVLSARLVKVAGPKFIKPPKPTISRPESTSPISQPARRSSQSHTDAQVAASSRRGKKGKFGFFS